MQNFFATTDTFVASYWWMIELIKSSLKMITCEIFSHVCVAGHQLPAVADILTHSVNMAFGPKSAFKNKCRAQTRFGLQNEACLHPIRLDAFLRLYLGIFLRGLMTFVLNKVKSLNKAKPMYPHIAVK